MDPEAAPAPRAEAPSRAPRLACFLREASSLGGWTRSEWFMLRSSVPLGRVSFAVSHGIAVFHTSLDVV